MKKEESNIGQLSLFDVIDGGKHGEAENVNLIKIKLELPHPTYVGWGFYGLTPVKPRLVQLRV